MWTFRICDCIKYLKSNCALAKDRNSTSKQIARYNSFLKNTVGDRKNQDLQSQLCIRLHCYVKKQTHPEILIPGRISRALKRS